MSADYLDLLLGRATGAVPAAEPRIHSAMAQTPSAVPVWGEVTEERVASYRSATPPPQHPARADIPLHPQQDPKLPQRSHEQQQAFDLTERSRSSSEAGAPNVDRNPLTPPRASADLLPPVLRQAETETPSSGQAVPQPNPPQVIAHAERPEPALPRQSRHDSQTSSLLPAQTLTPSLLPQREFAPALLSRPPEPRPAAEARAAPPSAPVTIRIDRIEVHAAPPAKTAAAPIAAKAPAVGLDDYLSRRKGAAR